MKFVVLLIAGVGLAGCASKPVTVEGIETSKETTFTMLGSRPADQVAECIGRLLKTSIQREGADYVLTIHQQPPADIVVYHIRSITDSYHRFATQVEQRGYSIDPSPSLGECLPGTA